LQVSFWCLLTQAKFTLRFPRFIKVRVDKPIQDIVTLEEIQQRMRDKPRMQSLVRPSQSVEQTPKRKGRGKVNHAVPAGLKGISTSLVPKDGNSYYIISDFIGLFQGMKIQVLLSNMYSKEESQEKGQLELLIKEHGGTPIQTLSTGGDTGIVKFAIALPGKVPFRCFDIDGRNPQLQ
jgi:hypothetical protein